MCAVVCGFFVLAACDDFNRSLEDDIDFYRSVTPVSSWAELKSAAEGTAGPGLIGLAGDMEPDVTITITRSLTITGFEGRRVVRRGAAFTADPLFRVDAGGGLTLGYSHPKGGTLVLDGGGVTANAPLVRVNGGALTLNGGAVLQNNDNSAAGGGVYVASGGAFTMNGGTISDNSYGTFGGGVYVVGSGSVFTMTGGTISDNSGGNHGGGVYFNSSGGVFTMNGGTISSNSSNSNGGGVSVNSGGFQMTGGTIGGNIARRGGGVFVSSSSTSFKKEPKTAGGTSGVIYGSGEGGDSNQAVIGHAVCVNSAPEEKKRNSTAGPGVTLNSAVDGTAGGWDP
ncbi:MAG: hypothetical protein LBO80_05170 [Treponema sp.]|nr:hypothetical protein [Treponema sp.]